MFANEVQVTIANQSTWQQPGLAENLKSVTNSEHKSPALCKLFDRVHHRRKASERSGAKIVAVRKTAGQDHGVIAGEICLAVPDEIDWLADVFRDHVIGVVITVGSGKNDNSKFHASISTR